MRNCLPFISLFALASGLLLSPTALADRDNCREARHAYHAAVENLTRDVRAYTSCVAQSRGEEDCAVAFADVESAQREFEDAVEHVRDECR